MAIKVNRKPIEREFNLKSDPEGEAKVSIRQATQGDVIKRADLFSRSTQVLSLKDQDGDTLKYEQQFNIHRQKRNEVFLTLTNAVGIVDEDNNEIFRTRETKDGIRLHMSEGEFNAACDLLHPDVFDEIHECVLEVNPMWGNKAQEGEF